MPKIKSLYVEVVLKKSFRDEVKKVGLKRNPPVSVNKVLLEMWENNKSNDANRGHERRK